MRAAALLATTFLAGCSPLLGIENPTPRGDAASDDDAPVVQHLTFSFGDFRVAQEQIVRIHVRLVHVDGREEDVTDRAELSSDDPTIATISAKGEVKGIQTGMANITARLDNETPVQITATVKANLCHPVINELATSSVLSPADEWVEIYNPCTTTFTVDRWTLDYRASTTTGATDSQLMVTLAGDLNPGDLRLYAGVGYIGVSDGTWQAPTGLMQQTDGAVGLRLGPKDIGPLIDSVAYGKVAPLHPFLGKAPTAAMDKGLSAARSPFDGNDDDDGTTDFKVSSMTTPGALNAR